MRSISMSKVLTNVLVALSCAIIILVSQNSEAQARATAPQATYPPKEMYACEVDRKSEACKKAMDQQAQLVDLEVRKAAREVRFGSCTEATKAYRAAQSTFSGKCGESKAAVDLIAKISGVGRSDGTDACRDNLIRCEKCPGGGDEVTAGESGTGRAVKCYKTPDTLSEIDEDEYETSTAANAAKLFSGNSTASKNVDKEKIERELLSCFPEKAQDLKGLSEEVTSRKKDIRKAEEDILDITAEISKANAEAQETRNSVQDDSEAIQAKAKEKADAVKRELDEGNARAANEIDDANRKIESTIRQLEYKKNEAGIMYVETVVRLDAGCHTNALARVEAVRKEQIELMKQSAFSGGNFNQFMTGVGKSSKQKFQRLADGYYRDCRNDRSYKAAKQSAERQKELAILTANQEINALRNEQTILKARLEQMKTQANQNAIKALQQIQENMTRQLSALDRKSKNLGAKNQQELMTKGLALNRLNRNLQEDQADYDLVNTKFRLARKHGIEESKEGSFDALLGAYSDTKSKALEVIAACCVPAETSGSTDSANETTACASACGYLGQWDQGSCPKYDSKFKAFDSLGVGEAK